MKRISCIAVFLLAGCTAPVHATVEEQTETPEGILQACPSTYQEMIQRDDIVIEDQGTLLNETLWDTFLETAESRTPAKVIIGRFTIEGDPVLYLIDYDGEVYHWYMDPSRDRFAADKEIQSGTAKYLLQFLTCGEETQISYVLSNEELPNLNVTQHTEIDGEPVDPPLQILDISRK